MLRTATLILGLLISTAIHAQTTWYVDDDCSGPGTGTQVDPYCEIADAIAASSDGDSIVVAPGTYVPISLTGRVLEIIASGNASETIIDANQAGTVVTIDGGDVSLQGFTITGGESFNGGGISVSSATASFSACCIQYNSTVNDGAGLYVLDSDVTLRGCTVRYNVCSPPSLGGTGDGGGLNAGNQSTIEMEFCDFHSNHVEGGPTRAGGALVLVLSDSSIRHCIFRENTTLGGADNNYGGAVYIHGGNTAVEDSRFIHNESGRGGAIQTFFGGDLQLLRCHFSGNTAEGAPTGGPAAGGGGAISIDDTTICVASCEFTNNAAIGGDGGGAIVIWNSPLSVVMGSLFAGNSSVNNAGAIYCRYATSTAISSCTIALNSAADMGGGIFAADGATPTVRNSILWGNTDEQVSTGGIPAGIFDIAYSCVQGGSAGTGNIDQDPLFTLGHGLSSGSPCVDTGDSSQLAADCADVDGDLDTMEPLPLDLADCARIFGSDVDMGAYEADALGFEFSFVPVPIPPCPMQGIASATIATLVTESDANPGFANGIDGLEMRIAHDPWRLQADSCQLSPGLQALNGSTGPDFFSFCINNNPGNGQPGFVVAAIVMDYDVIEVLYAPTPTEVVMVDYSTLPGVLEMGTLQTSLIWETGAGCGAINPTNTVVVNGASICPLKTDGLIEFAQVDDCSFVRGNCDGNEVLGIGDPIYALQYLFGGGPDPLCEKACDFDDSGAISLAGAIFGLQAFFSGGPPIPPPFPDPGVDPTPDSLTCAFYPVP